jgi:hypothetical protein
VTIVGSKDGTVALPKNPADIGHHGTHETGAIMKPWLHSTLVATFCNMDYKTRRPPIGPVMAARPAPIAPCQCGRRCATGGRVQLIPDSSAAAGSAGTACQKHSSRPLARAGRQAQRSVGRRVRRAPAADRGGQLSLLGTGVAAAADGNAGRRPKP